MNPYALLLDQAPPHVQAAVAARLEPHLRARLLGGAQAPGATLTRHVVADGTPGQRADLASNPHLAPEVFAALASQADGTTAARLFRNVATPRETRLAVLPHVAPGELLACGDPKDINERWSLQQRVAVLADSADPRRSTAALALLDPVVNRAAATLVLLRGCLGLLRSVGPETVAAVLETTAVPETADLRHALAPPLDESRIAADVARLGSTRALLALRYKERAQIPLELWHSSRPAPLDWDLVVAAHDEATLPENMLRALSRQLGCPRELFTDPHPLTTFALRAVTGWTGLAPGENPLPGDMERLMADSFNRRLLSMHEDGVLSADMLLNHGTPGIRTLQLFRSATGAPQEDFAAAIRRITTPRAGENPEAWVVALGLLDEFGGSVAELFTVAAAVVG